MLCDGDTHSAMEAQIANAVRNKMSLPSIRTKSHTRSTQLFGRHVQKSVKNHCIVNTLMIGGSIESIKSNKSQYGIRVLINNKKKNLSARTRIRNEKSEIFLTKIECVHLKGRMLTFTSSPL